MTPRAFDATNGHATPGTLGARSQESGLLGEDEVRVLSLCSLAVTPLYSPTKGTWNPCTFLLASWLNATVIF